MPQVQMPDGTIVEMPDKVDPALAARLQAFRSQGAVKKDEPSWYDPIVDTAKNVGSGLVRGVMALPSMLEEATSSAMDANPEIQAKRARLRAEGHNPLSGEDKKRMNQEFDSKLYKPKTRGQQYVQSAAQGVGGALTMGPATVPTAIAGATSGLGSEAAAQAFGEGPIQRVVGGLAGGLVGGLGTARWDNKARMAREVLNGVDESELAVAKQNMQLMQDQGVAGNLSQAMPRPSNIDTLVDTLANNRYGTRTQKQLRAQPSQVQMGLELEMAGLPGSVRTPQTVANNAQDVSTAVIDTAKQARGQAWKQAYDSGVGDLDAAARAKAALASQVADAMEARLQQARQLEAAKTPQVTAIPTGVGATKSGILLNDAGRGKAALNAVATADAKRATAGLVGPDGLPLRPAPTAGNLDDFASDFENASAAAAKAKMQIHQTRELPASEVKQSFEKLGKIAAERPNTGLGKMIAGLQRDLKTQDGYLTNAEQLNEVLKSHAAKLRSPDLATKGIDAGAAKYMNNLINDLREGWGEKFAPYKQANQVYAQQTAEIIDPLKKSVVGRMAGRKGEIPDVEATRSKLMGLFNQGTVPGSKSSDILKWEKSIRNVKAGQAGASVDGPAAYQDSVKTWMADKISEAVQYKGGRINDDLADKLRHAFQGNETKSQGFRDMLVGMARSQGMKDDALYPGVERFMKVVGMAARRPHGVQGAHRAGLDEIAGASSLRGVGNFSMITPVRQPILRWVEYLKADAYKAMDELLTSPEGVDMLQKLAKQRPGSTASEKLVATFAATTAAAQQPGESNPPGNTPP